MVSLSYCYEHPSVLMEVAIVSLNASSDDLHYDFIPLYQYHNFHYTVEQIQSQTILCEVMHGTSLFGVPKQRYYLVNERGKMVQLLGVEVEERIIQYMNGFLTSDQLLYFCSSWYSN